MRVIPIALNADYSSAATSIAHLLLITRLDGGVYAFTSASEDVVINGVRYDSTQGFDVTSFANASGLEVSNLELSTLNGGPVFITGEVLSGLWRGASFWLSKYNWKAPQNGIDVLMAGVVGNVQMYEDHVVAELRGLQQYFQQTIGNVTSKTCRARLGDSLCTKDLTAFTFSATVTEVTSQQAFFSSTLVQANDFFGNGTVRWLTGDNAGLRMLVKTFLDGTVGLALPTFLAIQIGDTFEIIAGCRLRLADDCFIKFNNVLNFQGEPHLPGIDAMTKAPA